GRIHANRNYDVVVVGAGIVGAACAYYLATAGASVAVVDRAPVAGGTTGRGEGNILVSDKVVGPELDLALDSLRLWLDLPPDVTTAAELEAKGGLVVADGGAEHQALRHQAASQRSAGVRADEVDGPALRRLEPHLAPDLAGGVFYPDDMQVQPMLAAALLVRAAERAGAVVRRREEVTAVRRGRGGVTGVSTTGGELGAGAVVNATGTWAPALAALAGSSLPVEPRRGVVLVTEPLPRLVHHKVYTADYVANVESDDAGLETSTVVEGTRSGTILIGASRERVGFDHSGALRVAAVLARGAIRLFPALAAVRALRYYLGFRPYCPDHLPVIGEDPRVPRLYHACGHEGAGVGLAPGTGHAIAALVLGGRPRLDLAPFSPARFDGHDG
ncbi:MAG TPA: FAD-binding oxidoreductase, partial [Acidimicrobiales bacterium]|nr:FAD-binding oxidoreductase [Acidimicrobiales bacterium]